MPSNNAFCWHFARAFLARTAFHKVVSLATMDSIVLQVLNMTINMSTFVGVVLDMASSLVLSRR